MLSHCPLPFPPESVVLLGHGGGGQLSSELLHNVFLPAFSNPLLQALGDAAVLPMGQRRLAMSTDSYVVKPLFFPGGDIGRLAVCGTVNDLAMMGARPEYLSVAFILEEGVPLARLQRVVDSLAGAAQEAGVLLVTGDTKVVERGHGDGVYLNTSGIGWIPGGVGPTPQRALPGDAVLVSGCLGDHGMAIMSVRDGLEFDTQIVSDCAPLADLVSRLLAVEPDVHVLRDPTRGGLTSTLQEIARASHVGIEIEEKAVPVRPAVASACEMLGLDPFCVANEGKLVCIAAAERADALLAALRSHPLGQEAAFIGTVVAHHPGTVVARTPFGTRRVLDPLLGDPLPRIC
ncbi:hydrogenase expression/formation protein HypE [bacterium]|nr:hydrogenase expression/formation protein HypE [bacterium]